MKIREVYPGGSSGSYVVLQMHAANQHLVSGTEIVLYDEEGNSTKTFTFAENVSNGSDQATILVADDSYAESPAADEQDSELHIPGAVGAVCFIPSTGSPDCVSWGGFNGNASLPSSAGTPASSGGVTAEMALHRTIEPNCETLLEPEDDTNDSATDFSEQARNPRNNSSEIVEEECEAEDTTPPETTIVESPPDPSSSTSASFKYESNEGGSTFECQLDGGGFEGCPGSGETYNELDEGSHTFEVRAEDEAGNLDETPASYTWTIEGSAEDTTPPDTSIDSAPPNPSESSTASFTYSSTEPEGATFECNLDGAGFSSCPASGITYEGLADGSHTFAVRATDEASNTDPTPAGYSWEVVLPEESSPEESSPPPPEEAEDAPPPPPPGTLLAAGLAPVRGPTAVLRVLCRGQEGARCGGVMGVMVPIRFRRGGRPVVRRVLIAKARYDLPADGKLRVLRVRLTRLGRRLVLRSGRRGLKAILFGKGVKNRVATLRAVPRRNRARRSDAVADASAFHLIKVREVHPDTGRNDSYVVLQMLASGEGEVSGRRLRVYDSAGAEVHTFTFSNGYAAPNDGHGNNTILVGDTGVQSAFGKAPDDKADAELEIPASGGAVCWLAGSPVDCVSWGDFSAPGSLPSATGTPAAAEGIPDGRALRRTIAPGCPTYLEASDDSDDSATDFETVFPDPRPNSEAPDERRCTGSDGETGGTDGTTGTDDGTAARRGTLLAAGLAPVRRGTALLRVLCRGQAGARCGGVLGTLARVRVRRDGRPVVRRVLIAKARYALPADGKLRVLRVRLTRLGRRLVLGSGRRGLKGIVFGKGVKNRVMTLRAAPRAAR